MAPVTLRTSDARPILEHLPASHDERGEMKEPDWGGFPARLSRSLDRWGGGGGRAFAWALRKYSVDTGTTIPTSYSTLLNYIAANTVPREAWVEAAAEVLRVPRDWLLYGLDEARGSDEATLTVHAPGPDAKTNQAIKQFLDHHLDLPLFARLMVWSFLGDLFRLRDELGVGRGTVKAAAVDYLGPLFTNPGMAHADIMALAHSLSSAAYVRAFRAERAG